MPVAGLTLTLHHDTRLAAEAVEEMRQKPEIEVGKGNGRWIPIVIDAEDQRGCRDLHRWIESLSGVEFADVVYVAFDDGGDEENSQPEPTPKAKHALEGLTQTH